MADDYQEAVPQAILDAANRPPPPPIPNLPPPQQAIPAPEPTWPPPSSGSTPDWEVAQSRAPAAVPAGGVSAGDTGIVLPPDQPSAPQPQQAGPAPLASGPTGQPATPSGVAPGAATAGARALPDVGTPAPAAGSAPSTGVGDGSLPFNPANTLAVGDSIAAHLHHYAGVPGSWSNKNDTYEPGNTAVAGWEPGAVFKLIKDIPDGNVKGKDIILSTGASNIKGRPLNGTDVASIVHQIDLLRTKGANSITVMGVGTAVDPRTNGALGRIARDNGAIFSGPLDPKNLSDGIHAKNYNQVRDQIYGAASSALSGGGGQGGGSVTLPTQPAPLPVGPDGQPIQRLPSIQTTALPTGTTVQGQAGGPQQQAPLYNPGSDPRGKVPVLRAAAMRNGIDPDLMVLAAAQEGLTVFKGDANSGGSYGAMQLNMLPGSVGDKMLKQTGIDPRLPQNEDATIDFAARYIAQHGWGEWNGPKKIGITGRMGIAGNPVPADIFTRGYRGGGRGGAPSYGTGSQAGYADGGGGDGTSLARFQQRVQGKDSQGFLTDVAATQTAPGFDGWMAKWMTLQNRVVMDAIVNGHADQVQHIEDAFTRMGYQGMNQNLMNMYQALGRKDMNAAAAYGTLAYANFPDGAHVKFQTDGKGNLFAQRIGEANGQPLGAAIPVTQDAVLKQMRFTNNPQTFQKFLSDQQASSVKAQLDTAKAGYWEGLSASRERMNDLNNKVKYQQTLATGQYGVQRAQIAAGNKTEPGQLTQQQADAMLQKVDEGFTTAGTIGGRKLDSPEGKKAMSASRYIAANLLTRNNRLQAQPVLNDMVERLAKGELQPAPYSVPGQVAIVDPRFPTQVLAVMDEDVAVRTLDYKPRPPQQAAPPPQQAAPPPQTVPAAGP